MSDLRVYLFGKPAFRYCDQTIEAFETRKLIEVFVYLLLFRDRPHSRESLAGIFWRDSTTSQSKKNLRQALWQIQSILNPMFTERPLLVADSEWIVLDLQNNVWVDVAEFEQAYSASKEKSGRQMDAETYSGLEKSVTLYRGDLLEGCYQEWCLFERERLQNIFLSTLDKLMDYCEANGCFEAGLGYGARILRCDWAHERTHRRLMRLYALSGDRTAALRQFDRCREVLWDELAVEPARSTIELCDAIRSGRFEQGSMAMGEVPSPPLAHPLRDMLVQLIQLNAYLAQVQQLVEKNIEIVEQVIRKNM